MARLPRLTVADYPHHVIQRGNNRQAVFASSGDYQTFLDMLGEYSGKFEVAIHAYVLMSNHFHLLLTPRTADGVPKMMQAMGRRYVRYFNDAQRRSGTLWEGRYKCALIQTERYLLSCMVYMDLNPVRGALVSQPQDYPWSSHGFYIGRRVDRLITPHALIWELGNTPFAREAAYAQLVQSGLHAKLQSALTYATLHGWALGEPDFIADLQRRTERRLLKMAAGRPPSSSGKK